MSSRETMDRLVSFVYATVFFIVSLLAGFHTSFLFAFIITPDKGIHKEAINYMYNEIPVSFNTTTEELIHMREVGSIFQFLHSIGILILIVGVILVIYTKIKRFIPYKEGFTLYSIILGILLIATFFFEWIFIYFHKVLFDNNYWIFPENSVFLIAYPPELFLFSYLILLLTSFGVLQASSYYLRN